MTKTGFLLIVIGLLIFADLSDGRIAVSADDESIQQRIDQLVQPYLDNHTIVGMTIGVIHEGTQQVFGYGRMSRDDGRVPDGNTIYEVGGVTNVLTGILLADAVIQGQVKLDQPAGELLPPGVKMPAKGSRAITLQDLSTHVSGLPRIPDNMKLSNLKNPYADYHEKDLYAFLNRHKLKRAPGTNSEYSNLGQGLLGHLLSRRANSTYEDLVRNRIAEPLKMSSTTITIDNASQSRLAPGHTAAARPAVNWDQSVLAGAGGVRASVNDLLLFSSANLHPPDNELGAAIEMAWTVHQQPIKKSDPTVGLGWHLAQDGTRWHNGLTGGYYSMILVNRQFNSSVVLMTNTATRDVEQLAIDIIRMISGTKVAPRTFEKPVDVPTEALQKFVGSYRLAQGAMFTVEVIDGKLMIGLTDQPSYQVFPRSEFVWFYKVVDAEITFNVDQDGKCNSLVLFQNGIKQAARRTGSQTGESEMTESWVGAAIITSVVFAFAMYYTLTAWFEHRERMAMIEKGLDPDTRQSIQNDS